MFYAWFLSKNQLYQNLIFLRIWSTLHFCNANKYKKEGRIHLAKKPN